MRNTVCTKQFNNPKIFGIILILFTWSRLPSTLKNTTHLLCLRKGLGTTVIFLKCKTNLQWSKYILIWSKSNLIVHYCECFLAYKQRNKPDMTSPTLGQSSSLVHTTVGTQTPSRKKFKKLFFTSVIKWWKITLSTPSLTIPSFWGDLIIFNNVLLPQLQTTIY